LVRSNLPFAMCVSNKEQLPMRVLGLQHRLAMGSEPITSVDKGDAKDRR
jgi:hypothetical protein